MGSYSPGWVERDTEVISMSLGWCATVWYQRSNAAVLDVCYVRTYCEELSLVGEHDIIFWVLGPTSLPPAAVRAGRFDGCLRVIWALTRSEGYQCSWERRACIPCHGDEFAGGARRALVPLFCLSNLGISYLLRLRGRFDSANPCRGGRVGRRSSLLVSGQFVGVYPRSIPGR